MMNPFKLSDAEEKARLEAVMAHATDGILTANDSGSIQSANPAVRTLFGYTEEEMLGRPLQQLVTESSWPVLQEYWEEVRRSATDGKAARASAGKGIEVSGLRQNGTTFPFLLSIRLIPMEHESFFAAFIHDISSQKQAIQALQVSENKLNAILMNTVDGIITIDRRGIIEMANPAAARLFGYDPAELTGKRVEVLMPEPDRSRHQTYMDNYHRTGVGKIIGIGRDVTGLRKDGSIFPFHLSISEVELYNRKVYTGLVHDITYQKLTEEKLRRYAQELERSNRDLQDFAYVSSHDLQEPLRKIQAFGDRLKARESENLSEQGREYVDRMLNAAARMQNLINDLLSFSRVTTQAQPFTWVDLNQILDGVLSDLEVSIERSGARIERTPLPAIEAEPTQIRQLFQNLLTNALKFRKPDVAPVIRVYAQQHQREAHLTATPGDETVTIFIEDNGIGFDEKYLDRIFNVFQRLEGQKYEGSGIGLALCRKIAVRHGGNITARSRPGEGATFIVTLSLRQTRDNEPE